MTRETSVLESLSGLVLMLVGACQTPGPGRVTRPIVGGEVDLGDPAVVALVHRGKDFCSGTLVSPRVVVTAAHCLDPRITGGVTFAQMGVFFGAKLGAADGETLAIADAKFHEEWDTTTLANDIGVLRLEKEVDVPPMPLNTAPFSAETIGATVRILGYGVQSATNAASGEKRAATSKVTEFTSTDFTYGGTPGQTCYGDSGGPAFLTVDGTEVFAGVTSWGDPDCKDTGVDTRVDAYVDSFVMPYIEQREPEPSCDSDGKCVADCEPRDSDCPPLKIRYAPGEACLEHDDCLDALCLAAPEDTSVHYCSQICDKAAPCPTGPNDAPLECAPTNNPKIDVCVFDGQTPGTVGWPCDTSSDCLKDVCLGLPGKASFCSKPCYSLGGGDCPLDYACADDPTGSPHFVCLPLPSHRGGCGAGGGSSSLAALLFLALARRRLAV